ncbi:MAG TPA: hypoxanthine phosphoribosyltransferase [Micromonosporaceae bacterium]|nr:hypoxanthine phosphoribosyltransferase [Micromonosporaceae bacterium]
MRLEDCDLTKDDVLFDEDQIASRLADVAADLDVKYADSDLLIVGVLTGAFMIVADLARWMSSHIEIDWIGVSSYGQDTRSSGIIRTTKDISVDVTGRSVLLVDDILDTGLTLSWLAQRVLALGAASVESCVLLRKPATPARRIDAQYVGFDIPDVFAVGFGLDHAGRYRNLRCVARAAKAGAA